tara:strand:+ start:7661 stop:9295 length:1635 start_codon:yes stop_codon:yes gene_type:complete
MFKLVFLFVVSYFSFSQNTQINIDGQFDDWENIFSLEDEFNDMEGVDFKSIAITNDDEFLYIKFETFEEIDLLDMEFNSEELYDIEIFIDTDNDSQTGFIPAYNENIGCELGIMFNQRYVWYNEPNPDVQISLYDLEIFPAPTVTSNQFEIAINLKSEYDGSLLFPNPEIKIQLRDWVSGDNIPNVNSEIIYNFNSNYLDYQSININKDSTNLIRLTAYNVLNNGLDDNNRVDKLKNILQALDSDIFAFSECYQTSEATVKNILDNILPVSNSEGWFVKKKAGDDLILASRFPIIQDWPDESSGIKKMHPCLIDLPDDIYAKDLLIINSHMSCCDSDLARQEQSDDFVNFILDAKTSGGVIDLDEGTPFVLCGDLNLVGLSQQLKTILTGEIINTDDYGFGGGMNWSNNELKDQVCMHIELPFSYTWRDINYDVGSYPYGRLDYIIFSDDVMSSQKSFSLDTEFISQQSLNTNNLNNDDSSGSDHLPITVDFDIPLTLNQYEKENIFKKLIRKINLLGQSKKTNSGMIINIYDDGSIEKNYVSE